MKTWITLIVLLSLPSVSFSETEAGLCTACEVGRGRIQLARLENNGSSEDCKRVDTGWASFYGKKFHGKRTASGQIFSMQAMTAAHKSLPFGSRVRVTNKRNGRSVVVTINDRGPFVRGRVIDLSPTAFQYLGSTKSGTYPVIVEKCARP